MKTLKAPILLKKIIKPLDIKEGERDNSPKKGGEADDDKVKELPHNDYHKV